MSDVGSRVVDFLIKQMQPDEKWIERNPNGFRWAFSCFGQEVTVEEARHPNNPEMIADIVNISSPMLENVEDTLENRRIINDYLCYNVSMCTPVFDSRKGVLFLNLRAPVEADTVDWMERLLSIAMVMQQHEVQKNAEQLAQLTHSRPAYYSHPGSGIRKDTDEILKVYSDLLVPLGLFPSKCTPDEIRDIASTKLQEFPFVLTSNSDTAITTELPQGIYTSLLEFDTEEQHPDYGHGLNLRHSFFRVRDESQGLEWVMYHNRQLSIALRSYGFGSFVYRDGFLVYRMFMPNLAYEKGMLWNLCLSSIVRARGINRYFGFPEWDMKSVIVCLEEKMKAISELAEKTQV